MINKNHLGDWEYYVFTDNDALWRSMNGVAAWFNGSDGLLSNAALMGSLILLTIFLASAALRSQKANAGTIGVWFMLLCTIGLTGRATIVNVYNGQTTVIDNVPAIALLPASIFSKAGYKVFTSTETAFQSASGSYMAVSQYGFMSPVQILARMSQRNFAMIDGNLSDTLAQVMFDCGNQGKSVINPNNRGLDIERSLDTITWLEQNGATTGLTKVYVGTTASAEEAANGTVVSCLEAYEIVKNAYNGLSSGNATMSKYVNSIANSSNPQHPDGKWNPDIVNTAFRQLIEPAAGFAGQDAFAFSRNMLTIGVLKPMLQCSRASNNLASESSCMSQYNLQAQTAVTQDLTDKAIRGAIEGSGFLRTMFTNMSMLQALFFALFPVAAIYCLVVPTSTGKVMGGYLLFGIWAQSWLLVVAPMQLFMQNEIIAEMRRIIGNSGGITIENYVDAMDVLRTKVGTAGNLMASAQMVALGLLTGGLAMAVARTRSEGGSNALNRSVMDSNRSQEQVARETGVAAPLVQSGTGYIQFGQGLSRNVKTSDYMIQMGSTSTDTRNAVVKTDHTEGEARERGLTTTDQAAAATLKQRQHYADAGHERKTSAGVSGYVDTALAKAVGGALGGLFGKKAPQQQVDQLTEKVVEEAQKKEQQSPGFISKLMGDAGQEAQADALNTVFTNVSNVAAGATLISGLVATASPAAPAGVAITASSAVVRRSAMQYLSGQIPAIASKINALRGKAPTTAPKPAAGPAAPVNRTDVPAVHRKQSGEPLAGQGQPTAPATPASAQPAQPKPGQQVQPPQVPQAPQVPQVQVSPQGGQGRFPAAAQAFTNGVGQGAGARYLVQDTGGNSMGSGLRTNDTLTLSNQATAGESDSLKNTVAVNTSRSNTTSGGRTTNAGGSLQMSLPDMVNRLVSDVFSGNGEMVNGINAQAARMVQMATPEQRRFAENKAREVTRGLENMTTGMGDNGSRILEAVRNQVLMQELSDSAGVVGISPTQNMLIGTPAAPTVDTSIANVPTNVDRSNIGRDVNPESDPRLHNFLARQTAEARARSGKVSLSPTDAEVQAFDAERDSNLTKITLMGAAGTLGNFGGSFLDQFSRNSPRVGGINFDPRTPTTVQGGGQQSPGGAQPDGKPPGGSTPGGGQRAEGTSTGQEPKGGSGGRVRSGRRR